MFFIRKRLRLYLTALLLLQVFIGLTCWRIVREGSVDFRAYYAAGHMVRAGDAQNLCDYEMQRQFQNRVVTPNGYALPMMEPPFIALAFVPLSFLSYLPAYFVFLLVNLLLLGSAIFAIRPYLSYLSARMVWAPALFFIAFFPVGVAFVQGQLSMIVLVLYCAAFVAMQRDKTFLAGLLLSVALFKLQIALPVALLFLLWRRWRFVAGFSAGAAALGFVSIEMIGIGHLKAYWASLFASSASASSISAQAKFAVYPRRMPNLYGLFYMLSSGHRWGLILTVACSVLLLLWAVRKPASLPLATLVALLVSYHLYIHDLTLLLLPMGLLVDRQLANPIAPERQNWRRLAGISAMAFLLITPVTLFLISSNWLPLLAIPILVLALALGPSLPDILATEPARSIVDLSSQSMQPPEMLGCMHSHGFSLQL